VAIVVAGEAVTRIAVVAFIAPERAQGVAMDRIVDEETGVVEEANAEASEEVSTVEAAGAIEEASMLLMDSINRMRRQIPRLRTPMSTRLSREMCMLKARHSNHSTPTLSHRSCLTCRHPLAYSRWLRSPTI